MASDEWASMRLGDVCTKIGSGATPRGGNKVYLDRGPYALIRSQNVYNSGFHRDGLVFLDEAHAAELSNVEVQHDDVLLNITGESVARCCQVDPSILPARVNQHVAIIRPDPQKLNPRFLRFLLASPEIQTRLLSWAGSGGTRNALTKGMIESLEVLTPRDVGQQRAIAHILGTLDEKIDLIRRTNETLEVTVRAIFKSWFVDFDPVRAKAEGRNPGLPNQIADHFPACFEDSELGEIPKGWEVTTFRQVLTSSTTRVMDASLPEYSATVKGLFPRDDRFKKQLAKSQSKNKRIEAGDLVFGLSRRVINFGLMREGRGAVSPVYEVFRIDSTKVDPVLLEQLFRFNMHTHMDILRPGAREGQPIDREFLLSKLTLIPDRKIQCAFQDFIGPYVRRIQTLELESNTLSALRDTLLPKLISGELRVKHPASFLKGVSA